MEMFTERILESVEAAGHWGVLRTGLLSPECFKIMAEMVGMSPSGGFGFRNRYFADGVKDLNPKAITALCLTFGIERKKIEELNEKLKSS